MSRTAALAGLCVVLWAGCTSPDSDGGGTSGRPSARVCDVDADCRTQESCVRPGDAAATGAGTCTCVCDASLACDAACACDGDCRTPVGSSSSGGMGNSSSLVMASGSSAPRSSSAASGSLASSSRPFSDGVVQQGVVSVLQEDDARDDPDYNVSAQFLTRPTAAACQSTAYGDCTITTCEVQSGTGITFHSAGLITFTGATTVTLPPGDSFLYSGGRGFTALLQGGAPFRVESTGGDVAPFQRTLTAPYAVTVTKPQFAQTGTLNRVDHLLQWTPQGSGHVRFSFNGSTGTQSVSFSCRWPVEQGRGTISGAGLVALPPVTNANHTFFISTGVSQEFAVAEDTVTLSLGNGAFFEDDQMAAGRIVLGP